MLSYSWLIVQFFLLGCYMMILAVTDHTVVGPWCVFDVLQCFKTGLMAAEMELETSILNFF